MKTKFLLLRNLLQMSYVVLIIVLSCIILPVTAQTQSQEKYPTQFRDENSAGVSYGGWSYMENLTANDNAVCSSNLISSSYRLITELYDFSIPGGSVIKGIEVAIGRSCWPYPSISDLEVTLTYMGIPIGVNKADMNEDTRRWPENETEKIYGNSNDLWGTNLTASGINSYFGVAIRVQYDEKQTNFELALANIDYIKVKVYYEPLDPSLCMGSAVEVLAPFTQYTLNPANALNTPDGNVATISGKSAFLSLDLTGVTPRPVGNHVTVKCRDIGAQMGHSIVVYQATTCTNATCDWNSIQPTYILFNAESGLVDKVITIGKDVRYLGFTPYGDYAFDIDAVTYSCGCTTPTVSVEGPTSICVGGGTTLSPTTGGTWVSNNPSVASVTNAGVVTGLDDGTASFTFTVTEGTCSNTTEEVTVNPSITPSVTITSSLPDNKKCETQNTLIATFTANVSNTGGGEVSYVWYYNGIPNYNWNQSTWDDDGEMVDGGRVSCKVTVAGTCLSSPTATSNEIITRVYPDVQPTVRIVSDDPDNEICSNTVVTFTAIPENTNGGVISYVWYYNGIPNNNWNQSTWDDDGEMENGDVVSCSVTVTNGACFGTVTATSNEIITTVYPSGGTATTTAPTICSGESAVLTLSSYLGSIQWQYFDPIIEELVNVIGGTGSTSNVYTTPPLTQDTYFIAKVTGGTCSPYYSNELLITVNPNLTIPSVTITSSDADNKICNKTWVTFTATPSNTGGGTVAYQWNKNGDPLGANQDTYSSDELYNEEVVSCEITVTGGPCLTSTTAVSNKIMTNVYDPNLMPSVTIASSDADNEICNETLVTFKATPKNTGGGTVSYQWKKNGDPIGDQQDTYSSDELYNEDVVSCEITITDAACFDGTTVASNEIIIDVIPLVEVTIASDDADNSIVYGKSVTFTPTLLNYIDGTIVYYWYKIYPDIDPLYVSGQNIYTTTSLADGDIIWCVIEVTGGTCPETTSRSNMITVRVNQCISGQADCFEPNNTLTSAALIFVDTPDISANILNAKDLDWFKFTTADAGYYTINFNANGGKETVELCNAKGQKLRSGSKTSLTYNLLANTTYYIKVYDAKLKTPSLCYSLGVTYNAIMPAGGFIEANMDLKVAEIEPIADGICKIWPNPTKNEFQFYNGNETPVQVRVMDVTGRQIETIENVGIAETAVFGSKYKPGIYFIITSENGVQKVFKLIKQ